MGYGFCLFIWSEIGHEIGGTSIMCYTGMCRPTGYGFCLSDSETGSKKQRFCLEQGLLFAHSDSGKWLGLRFLFSWQNHTATKNCCCSCLCPAACLLKHTISDLKVNCVSHSGTGYLFSPFVQNRVAKLCLLVWNRVRFPGTQRHTPTLNWGGVPPPPPPP